MVAGDAAPPAGGPWFATADGPGREGLRRATEAVLDALARAAGPGPFSGIAPAALADAVDALEPCPEEGRPLEAALEELGRAVLAHGVRPADPLCAAHLHCPPLIAAAAAELAIGATNQSLDSYEQAPAATLVEDRLVSWLARLLGLGPRGSGVMTAGGTASNLLGLLLARDAAARAVGADLRREGLPPEARSWRVLASRAAHDSVRRGAMVLGLGTDAVVGVAVDARGRLDLGALDAAIADLERAGLRPIALAATAGTTDLGAIDPLAGMAERAAALGAWLHVDAAVGSALALSPALAGRLGGLERADSVTADLHKLWWQPISASALLVRDAGAFAAVDHRSDYLNRPEDEGVLNLVARSLDTSRRFDALKAVVALRTLGRRRMAALVERVVALAEAGAAAVRARPELELLAPPETVMVAFRWRPPGLAEAELDAANTAIQRRLFASGRALVGRTRAGGAVALKLTLVNPLAAPADLERILDLVAAEGAAWRAGEGR